MPHSKLNFVGVSELHRNGITANDTAAPTDTTGSVNMQGYSHAKVNIIVTGTNTPTWDVIPLFWDKTAERYFAGETELAVGEGYTSYIIPTDQTSNFYCMVNNKQGTNPNITIYVQGCNRL